MNDTHALAIYASSGDGRYIVVVIYLLLDLLASSLIII